MGGRARVESGASLFLADISHRLRKNGINWAVFAGAAANVYGATRPLTDVDILVPAAEGRKIAVVFPEGNAKRRKDGSIKGVALPGFDLVAGLTFHPPPASGKVDLDHEMVRRRMRRNIAGINVPVIPPEDNILIKAVWGRGPEVGKHDWEDVEAMLAHLPDLDWKYLRRRAAELGPREQIEQLLKRLEFLRRKHWT